MKIKINEQITKLTILKKLQELDGILDTMQYHDLEQLASRINCNPALLYEVLESMDCEMVE